MRKTRYFVFAVAMVLSPGLARANELSARAQLDHDIPRILAATGIPSVSIAQIHHGRVALTVAYGSQSAGRPATKRTLYNIASLSKPLTAETILRLASKGAFGLDDPMYLSWTDPDIANDPRTKLLTLRFALSHRTGFPNWRDRKAGLAFKADPGTKVGYSGEGYQYAARFVEKKTGQSFETLAQTTLFDKVGMKDTSYVREGWFKGRIAIPTDEKGSALEPFILDKFNAADGVYTTAGDYARFVIAVLNNQNLSPAIANERDRIQAATKEGNCKAAHSTTCQPAEGFGLGWQILAFQDTTLMMHTGKDDGVFTLAYIDKGSGDGAVILTNSDKGAELVIPVLERLGARPEYLDYLRR